jgi:beta-N-acetylglucosaminidase
MRFYGAVKTNTYIYAPKDDPYHRDEWRIPLLVRAQHPHPGRARGLRGDQRVGD